jgi:hypothetical protein
LEELRARRSGDGTGESDEGETGCGHEWILLDANRLVLRR